MPDFQSRITKARYYMHNLKKNCIYSTGRQDFFYLHLTPFVTLSNGFQSTKDACPVIPQALRRLKGCLHLHWVGEVILAGITWHNVCCL